MIRSSSDPKVKKTLLRNCERKIIKPTVHKEMTKDAEAGSSKSPKYSSRSFQKDNELSRPILCSSEALANYISDLKKIAPIPPVEDINVDKNEICAKMTKKLNFHFNDRIFKNLIELNANVEEFKSKKDKRPVSAASSTKRDQEPNIEDFYENERECDVSPNIPILKPKLRPAKKIENGHLHRLVASFEDI